MKIDGACHCGNIAYEAEIDPATATVCHCSDCQTLSGTAFRTVVMAPEDTFRLLSGAPRIYIKTAESGNRRMQTFCPDCGTPLYSGPPEGEGRVFALRIGSVRQRDELVPQRQIWARSAQGWLGRLDGLERIETQ